jgi:hypothetical protein
MSKERELVNELFRKYLRPDDAPSLMAAAESIERRLDVLTIRVAALERQLRTLRSRGGGAE